MKIMALATVLATVALASLPAHAQTSARIRGTIVSVDATTMALKSRDGKDLVVKLADNLGVAVAQPVRFDDIKEGDYVGTTTKRAANGDEVAVEVHYLAPTVPPGQLAWDLEPNSRMTNASVRRKVVGTGNHELTLQFDGTEQRIVVPDGIPLVKTVPGTRADLVPGEYVFLAAQVASDGALTAQRVQVSKNGVRPPQ